MHPHNQCPVCKEEKELDAADQLEAMIASIRTSAQDTLTALWHRGFVIRKT